MVDDYSFLLQSLAWPLVLLVAWWLGEHLHTLWKIPRVTSYVAVGLLASAVDLRGMTGDVRGLSFLANFALALVLFELGYRINLRWFRNNPWVPVTGVLESLLIFGGAWFVTGWFELSTEVRLIVSALCMAASPAGIVRVANELRSAGQVTERVMHLCAINCLMTVVVLKLVVGYWHLSTSGDWTAAALGSVYALIFSVAVGGALGILMPWLLRGRSSHGGSVTVLFALVVLLLTTASYGLKLSPLLAALTFGLVARERRVQLTSAQRDFGSMGEITGLFLFVYVASLVNWSDAWSSLGLAAALLVVRLAVTTACNVGLSYFSGVTLRKGLLTGLALTPMSAYAILLLEQSRRYGLEPAAAAFTALAGLVLILELLGPLVTQRSLMAARETHITQQDA